MNLNLSLLTNDELTTALEKLCGDERATTLSVLYHLTELESRGLFREQGYSSLFDYCTRKLRYSESSAYRRIAGARCIADRPELAELFLDGKVTLCTIATAARSIKAEATKVSEIVGKTKREVESLLALTSAASAKPKERVRALVVKPKAVPLLPVIPEEERYELRFSVTKEVFEQIESAKARLSNKLGKELSLEAVVVKLIENYLKPKSKQTKLGTSNTRGSKTRYIPQAVRRAVEIRDGERCTYAAPDGTRCCEDRYLHFDHIRPFARGGRTEVDNLRLLCPAHNRLMAEQVFGRQFMSERIGREVLNFSTGGG